MILLGIFFHPNVPNYLNYGGIGSIIGHEITHGFDDQGAQYDSTGSVVNWWKPETAENFRKKAQCIIWQYGNYTVKQVNMTINGKLTQGENIADNGGFKEAYIAYGKICFLPKLPIVFLTSHLYFDPLGMWEEKHGSEPGLPGHSFTSKQLFWIALAQVSLFYIALMFE